MKAYSNTFGITFSNVSLDVLGNEILEGRHSGQIIVTPNVDHIVRFHADEKFKKIYNKADLFVNDSRILKVLSSLGLQRIESLIPGSDLTAWLFEHLPKDIRISIIGASCETISVIKNKYEVKNLYHYNPPMGFINDKLEVDKCLVFCEDNPSDIYFFAVGSPRQEILADLLKERGAKGALLCIGASMLFLSGEEKRAPKLIQRLHAEWLFRLVLDPKRLYRRYLIDGPNILKIYIKELLK